MRISFRQGIVSHQTGFLQASGTTVNLLADNRPTTVSIAHKGTNYIHSEDSSVVGAWTGLTGSQSGRYWLYWDFNLLTFAASRSFTDLEPIQQAEAPTHGNDSDGIPWLTNGRLWYDTDDFIHYEYNGGSWFEVLRVFAGVSNGTLTPTSVSIDTPLYTGTQIGNTSSVRAGRVLFGETGRPIQRDDRTFFTTEDQFFTNQSRVDALRLESNVTRAASETTTLSAFSVVAWTNDGKVSAATYPNVGSTVVGILTETIGNGEVGAIIVQGAVTNPSWSWILSEGLSVGAPLWVDAGALVTSDPYPTSFITKQVPVARVLADDTVIFEQGLGGVGPQGPRGLAGVSPAATTTTLGSVALSATPPIAEAPVVVETNDSRLSDARAPLAHNHDAENILFDPSASILISTNVQAAIEEMDPYFVLTKDGSNNIFGGDGTGTNFTTADNNFLVGASAGYEITTGDNNVVIGESAGRNLTTGNQNILIGNFTAEGDATSKLTGSHNVCMGEKILENATTAGNNIAIGRFAGYKCTTGGFNTLIGRAAGGNLTTGATNVAVGSGAGGLILNGIDNVFLGNGAGQYVSGSSSGVVCIGNRAGPTYGAGAISNELYINNEVTLTPLIHGNFSTQVATINGDLNITGNIGAPLDALNNVIVAGSPLVTGQVLTFNGTNWVNQTPSGGGGEIYFDANGTVAPTAGSTNDVAIGNAAQTTATGALAIGPSASAASSNSISIGNGANAYVGYASSIAIGDGSIASGTDTIAIGQGAYAYGYRAISVGDSYASSDFAIAVGYLSNAGGDYSISIGTGSSAGSVNTIAIGKNAAATASVPMKIKCGTTSEMNMDSDGKFSVAGTRALIQLPQYTAAQTNALTMAAADDGSMVFVTDETGGAVPAFYDHGTTTWRRVTDRTAIAGGA